MNEAGDRPHSPGGIPPDLAILKAPVAMRDTDQQGLHKEE